jgi:hypothetical protein
VTSVKSVVHVLVFFAFRDDLPQRGFSFWASVSSDLGSQFRMTACAFKRAGSCLNADLYYQD